MTKPTSLNKPLSFTAETARVYEALLAGKTTNNTIFTYITKTNDLEITVAQVAAITGRLRKKNILFLTNPDKGPKDPNCFGVRKIEYSIQKKDFFNNTRRATTKEEELFDNLDFFLYPKNGAHVYGK